jgi:hypothetical protein
MMPLPGMTGIVVEQVGHGGSLLPLTFPERRPGVVCLEQWDERGAERFPFGVFLVNHPGGQAQVTDLSVSDAEAHHGILGEPGPAHQIAFDTGGLGASQAVLDFAQNPPGQTL